MAKYIMWKYKFENNVIKCYNICINFLKRKVQNMQKILRAIIALMTFVALLLGTGVIITASNKIIGTSAKLIALHDNASFYNEQVIKTDDMTEGYLENHNERLEIYNSEDVVVRTFSNQNFFVKTAILFVALAMYPVMLLVWVSQISNCVYKVKRKVQLYRQERAKAKCEESKAG